MHEVFELVKFRPNKSAEFLPLSWVNPSRKPTHMTMCNIELKTPYFQHIKQYYNLNRCAELVNAEIQRHGLAQYCIVQSFDHRMMELFECENARYLEAVPRELREFSVVPTLYLYPYFFDNPLANWEIKPQGNGVNL